MSAAISAESHPSDGSRVWRSGGGDYCLRRVTLSRCGLERAVKAAVRYGVEAVVLRGEEDARSSSDRLGSPAGRHWPVAALSVVAAIQA